MNLSFLDRQGTFGRRSGEPVDTVIIHSCYNPRLMSVKAIDCFNIIAEHGCSVHYLIDEEGARHETLPHAYKAFHAGKGMLPVMLDARCEINEFSLGIEVLGFFDDPKYVFTKEARTSLRELLSELRATYPIKYIFGHHQTAPSRKRDPGRIIW